MEYLSDYLESLKGKLYEIAGSNRTIAERKKFYIFYILQYLLLRIEILILFLYSSVSFKGRSLRNVEYHVNYTSNKIKIFLNYL